MILFFPINWSIFASSLQTNPSIFYAIINLAEPKYGGFFSTSDLQVDYNFERFVVCRPLKRLISVFRFAKCEFCAVD